MTAPEPEQVAALTAALDAIGTEIAELRTETHLENEKRDRRISWSRSAIGAVMIVAVLALVVGYSAKATGDDIVAVRGDTRVQSCDQDNARADGQRSALDDVAVAVKQGASVVNTPNPNRTPDQQAAVDAFVANYNAAVDAAMANAKAKVPVANSSVACKLAGRHP